MHDPELCLRSELRDLAAERHGDPARGLARIEELGDQDPDDPEIVGMLGFLRGLFLKELARQEEALTDFQAAVTWASDHGLTDIEARARANLAILLTDGARPAEADEQMMLAERVAPESARGLVTYLRALLMQRRGHHHLALDTYDRAVPLLRGVEDLVTLEVLRLNRGVSLVYLDDLEGARDELVEAETAAARLGLTTLAAMAAHNLGFLESRRGFLADALAALDRAEARYRTLSWRPKQLPLLHSDRAEVLLQAGLATDARVSAGEALEALGADGAVADLIEARLLLARACLATGDYVEAKQVALQATREFRVARRFGWATQAAYVARQVDYHLLDDRVGPGSSVSRRFEYLATRLAYHGWPVEGRDALVYGALAALADGDTVRAETLLRRAARLSADGAVQHRARLCLARARLLRQTGNTDKAAAVVRRGVREALEVLAVTGSTEARLEALRFAGELAAVGTSIALEGCKPIPVLRAVEQQRSVATALAPVGIPDADDDEPHRAPAGESHRAPDGSSGLSLEDALDGLRTGGLESGGDVEQTVREHSLRSRPEPGRPLRQLSWRDLRLATTSRNLVYFLDADDSVRAVVVRGQTTRIVELAAKTEVIDQAAFLQFAVQRLSALGSAGKTRALSGLDREAARLHAMLIEPLDLRPGPTVVVPCEAVKDVLWSSLPLNGHDISLAASGVDWVDTVSRPETPMDHAVFVSGPRLEAGEREVAEIAAMYRNATVLSGAQATVRTVLDSFADADLVHIAAHGVFRSESPMFSRLELADGPLTIYDLERLRGMPGLVVLSACEIAANRLYPSGGALGTATALTALGARTVIAPVQPVSDSATRGHMVAFHEHLVRGVAPAGALRLATADARHGADGDRIAAAAVFVATGAG